VGIGHDVALKLSRGNGAGLPPDLEVKLHRAGKYLYL
jgi:hypothetical protein